VPARPRARARKAPDRPAFGQLVAHLLDLLDPRLAFPDLAAQLLDLVVRQRLFLFGFLGFWGFSSPVSSSVR
jgi:hypothetical protein